MQKFIFEVKSFAIYNFTVKKVIKEEKITKYVLKKEENISLRESFKLTQEINFYETNEHKTFQKYLQL